VVKAPIYMASLLDFISARCGSMCMRGLSRHAVSVRPSVRPCVCHVRPYTTFYWSAVVSIALTCTIFTLIDVEWYCDLEILVRGSLEVIGYGFLFAFRSNYGSILHDFRDKARHWSKIVIFHTPLHSTPPLRDSRRNIATPFGTGKPEWCG